MACFVVHQLAVQVSSQSFCRLDSVVVVWKCPTAYLLRIMQHAVLYWLDLYIKANKKVSCKNIHKCRDGAAGH